MTPLQPLRERRTRICVYAGSNPGDDPAYRLAAETLGRALAVRGIGMVYGGGRTGLMGAVADAVLAAGGEVVGVIPRFLVEKEIAHPGLTDLRMVESMHERKALMAELSDGFIALPGGIGTLEEIIEVWTWGQLGRHAKPCALLDVAGFYGKLGAFLDHLVDHGFLNPLHRAMLIMADSPEAVLDACAAYRAPVTSKWLERPDQV